MNLDTIWQLDATAQAALIAAGAISARELIEATAARIERLDPALNAVAHLDLDAALAQAQGASGPFAGVPCLAKDVLAWPGMPATMGSRLFARHVPTEHVPYTARMAASGLVCLGKTTTSELGLLGSTETRQAGVTRNPWGPDWSAGGSSGGSAAAVAAGLVPLAHASDGGGSIRLPAALNGVFGFKPSRGATAPSMPGGNAYAALTSDHCLTRSVRDSAAFLAATALDPAQAVSPGPVGPLRIGVYTHDALGQPAAPESLAAVEAAAALCAALGHHVEPIAPPAVSAEALAHAFFVVAGAAVTEVCGMMAGFLGRAPGEGELEPFTRALAAWFAGLPADGLAAAQATLDAQGRAMRAFLTEVDVALCPTAGGARLPLGHLAPHLPRDVLVRRTTTLAGFTAFHNPAGAPAMSVPLHWTAAGLPVGCQFAARPGADATLLRLAYQLEAAQPWADRWPDCAR